MSEISLQELDAQFSELLPEREALGCIKFSLPCHDVPCQPHHHHPEPKPCEPKHNPCSPKEPCAPHQENPCPPPHQPCDDDPSKYGDPGKYGGPISIGIPV